MEMKLLFRALVSSWTLTSLVFNSASAPLLDKRELQTHSVRQDSIWRGPRGTNGGLPSSLFTSSIPSPWSYPWLCPSPPNIPHNAIPTQFKRKVLTSFKHFLWAHISSPSVWEDPSLRCLMSTLTGAFLGSRTLESSNKELFHVTQSFHLEGWAQGYLVYLSILNSLIQWRFIFTINKVNPIFPLQLVYSLAAEINIFT